MPSYVTPKKNTEYIFYVGLTSQANTKIFQSNPTLAAGDAQVSTDGGALGNLATIPAVTPGSSKMVKVTVSAGEMNGDNVTVVFSDAAGAEWCDLVINIQTSARQVDDLAFPTTSGRSIDVSATGEVEANVTQIDGQATSGNNATLNLKQLNIVNNAGSALVASSTGGNGHGIAASGNGNGEGLSAIGGQSGHGFEALGGSLAGDGIHAAAQNNGEGINAEGSGANQHGIRAYGVIGIDAVATGGAGLRATGSGGSQPGIEAIGTSGGAGLRAVGGTTGAGIQAVGGATSGSAIQATATAGNGHGMNLAGQGSGHGLNVTGGATGNGLDANGGATSGDGINAAATTSGDGMDLAGAGAGHGLRVIGGASNGDGINAVGQGSGQGADLSSSGSGAGMTITGANNAPGLDLAGAGVGAGLRATGGASGGDGIAATGQGVGGHGAILTGSTTSTGGDGLSLVGGGASHGLNATGGATGNGINARGGATSGDGINAAAPTLGDGMELAGAGGGYDLNATTTDNLQSVPSAMSQAALADFFTIDSGETYGTSVAGSVVQEIAANAGGSGLTAQDVRDAMKLAPTAGAPAAGSVDEYLEDILDDTGTSGVVLSSTTQTNIADTLLRRDWSSVAAPSARSVLNALRAVRNRVRLNAGTLTVYQEDDTTAAWTAPVTTDAAALPIVEIDPT